MPPSKLSDGKLQRRRPRHRDSKPWHPMKRNCPEHSDEHPAGQNMTAHECSMCVADFWTTMNSISLTVALSAGHFVKETDCDPPRAWWDGTGRGRGSGAGQCREGLGVMWGGVQCSRGGMGHRVGMTFRNPTRALFGRNGLCFKCWCSLPPGGMHPCNPMAWPSVHHCLGRLREAIESMGCHPGEFSRLLQIVVDKGGSHNPPRLDGRQTCHETPLSVNDILTLVHLVKANLGKRHDKPVTKHLCHHLLPWNPLRQDPSEHVRAACDPSFFVTSMPHVRIMRSHTLEL